MKTIPIRLALLAVMALILAGCSQDESGGAQLPETEPTTPNERLYFPPTDSDNWASISPDSLGWETSKLDALLTHMEENDTRAFLILKDGKIVVEEYWGRNFLDIIDFDQNTIWYWASASKTLVASTIGIAQEQGLLDINDSSSNYLGAGWTDISPEKEALIRVHHQLTMSTGLEYLVLNQNCTESSCLTYRTDAGDQWYYHNATYLLLKDVLTSATNEDYAAYMDRELSAKIGLRGSWLGEGLESLYWSTAREMARFGLLMQNEGDWDGEQVIKDKDYLNAMTNTSQELNPSYGYLWWLNGKESIRYPGLGFSIGQELSPNAPEDLFAGMGKNGQFVEIIPSQNLVVIRMGEAPDDALVPIEFHNEMWEKINAVIR